MADNLHLPRIFPATKPPRRSDPRPHPKIVRMATYFLNKAFRLIRRDVGSTRLSEIQSKYDRNRGKLHKIIMTDVCPLDFELADLDGHIISVKYFSMIDGKMETKDPSEIDEYRGRKLPNGTDVPMIDDHDEMPVVILDCETMIVLARGTRPSTKYDGTETTVPFELRHARDEGKMIDLNVRWADLLKINEVFKEIIPAIREGLQE